MFGRKKSPVIELLGELYAEELRVQGLLDKERADLIRARVNVKHHEAQIVFLNSKLADVASAITTTEREEDERKASEGSAPRTTSRWSRFSWRPHRTRQEQARAEQDRWGPDTEGDTIPCDFRRSPAVSGSEKDPE